jgi:hypothetical protein
MPRSRPISPEGRRLRGRAAVLSRPDRDPERAAPLRRQLKRDALARHIQEALDTAPPLTLEDRAELVVLLLDGAA